VTLVTCAVAVYVVVDRNLSDNAPSSPGQSTQRATPTTTTSSKAKGAKRRSYTVRAGDTLSAISIKTGVPLQTIQRLNPKLDAETLHAGQKVRLAP
jgi:LysM repeat protein